MTSHSVLIQELVAVGDMWRMSILEIGTADGLMRAMWPNSAGPPYGVTIAEEIIITEPDVIGTFEIRGLTAQALGTMEEGFARRFEEAGFNSGPAQGYTRVWRDRDTFYDYNDADFAEYYVDNFVGFRIQPDPWKLDQIDNETLTVHLSNGLTLATPLGDLGGSRIGDIFILKDSVIVPASGFTREAMLDQVNCPRLNRLRLDIHLAIEQMIRDRLEIALIVAAFADVFMIASGGGDPDAAEKILKKAREAAELERDR